MHRGGFGRYLTYLVERGQASVITLADLLGRGCNLLDLRDAHVCRRAVSQQPDRQTGLVGILCCVGPTVLALMGVISGAVSPGVDRVREALAEVLDTAVSRSMASLAGRGLIDPALMLAVWGCSL